MLKQMLDSNNFILAMFMDIFFYHSVILSRGILSQTFHVPDNY